MQKRFWVLQYLYYYLQKFLNILQGALLFPILIIFPFVFDNLKVCLKFASWLLIWYYFSWEGPTLFRGLYPPPPFTLLSPPATKYRNNETKYNIKKRWNYRRERYLDQIPGPLPIRSDSLDESFFLDTPEVESQFPSHSSKSKCKLR